MAEKRTLMRLITGTIERDLLVKGRCGHIVCGGPSHVSGRSLRQHPALDAAMKSRRAADYMAAKPHPR
jgi:hypothetical protein